jgi:Predicted phosphatase/phosphohexomutase
VIKALLFDFDGTLVDTESIDLRVWQEVFEAHGVSVPVDRFALRIGTLTGPDELDELDALLDAPCERDAVNATRRRRERELLELEPLRPGIREYLDRARSLGLGVAIVSSSSRSWIDGNLQRLDCSTVGSSRLRRRGHHALQAEPGSLPRSARDPRSRGCGDGRVRGLAERDHRSPCCGDLLRRLPERRTSALDLSNADLVLESLDDVPLDDLIARVG